MASEMPWTLAYALLVLTLWPISVVNSLCDVTINGKDLKLQCNYLDADAEEIGAKTCSDVVAELGRKLVKFRTLATSMTLDLQHNGIGNACTRNLSIALGKSTGLTSLHLQVDGNSIGDDGARALGVALGKLRSLTSMSLSMRYNEVGSVGLGDLGAGIAQLTRLRSLTLEMRFNHVKSAGLGNLGRSLAKLTMLKFLKLDLYSSGIENAGVSDLAESLVLLTNLSALALDLRYNNIDADGHHDLSTVVDGLKGLTSKEIVLPTIPSTPEASGLEEQRKWEGLEHLAALRERRPAYAPRLQYDDDFGNTKAQYNTGGIEMLTSSKTPATTTVSSITSTSAAAKETLTDAGSTASLEADDTTTPALEEQVQQSSGSAIKNFLTGLFALALIIGTVLLALKQNGYNVVEVLRSSGIYARDFATNLLQGQQARDYTSSLSEEMAAHTEQGGRLAQTEPPDLASRVDMAVARISAQQRGQSREVSMDDFINQNLSRLPSTDRME